jgi:hypothetical protein
MKVDPSQTKTVIALLVALVVAIGVTISRMHPSAPPEPIAQASVADADKAVACVTESVDADPTRNPFAKPAVIQAVGESVETALRSGAPKMLADNIKISPWRVDNVELTPRAVASVSPEGHAISPQAIQVEKAPQPEFELMATVKGRLGYSAVMRTNGSETRVVEVGDKMEGGFKIVKIEPERAVLTDGTHIVTAKRPMMGSAERRVESGKHDAG